MTTPKLLAAAILVASSANALAKPTDVRLEISNGGRYTLQSKAVALSDLRARLLELKAANPDAQVHVVGSPNASHAQVAPVIKIIEELGLSRLRFVTDWPDAPAASVNPLSASTAYR